MVQPYTLALLIVLMLPLIVPLKKRDGIILPAVGVVPTKMLGYVISVIQFKIFITEVVAVPHLRN